MAKSPDAFRTISEVAEWLGIQAHVLRFWESKFNQVKPVKRAGGRRYYRPSDMVLLGGIKKLLHDDGMTIKGVQKLLREQGVSHVSEFSQSLDRAAPAIDMEVTETDVKVVNFPPQGTPLKQPAETADQMILGLETPPLVPEDDAQEAEIPEPVSAVQQVAPVEAENLTSPEPEPAVAEAAPEPEAPRPRVIDVADPPEESEIDAVPGPLAALAAVTRLTSDQIDQLTPLAQELEHWLRRQQPTAVG